MNFFSSIIVYICFLQAVSSLKFKDANTVDWSVSPIIFNSTTTKHEMFKKLSTIPVYIANYIKLNDLIVVSMNTSKIHKYIKIEYATDTLLPMKIEINNTLIELKPSAYRLAYIYIDAIIVGKEVLEVSAIVKIDKKLRIISVNHSLIITTPVRALDIILQVYMIIFQIIVSTFMGLLIDIPTLLKIVKMPVAVGIGLATQFICMPLMACAYAKVFSLPPVDALALFIYGTCPGGSASNNWTIMFNGDIDLSAIMTFFSTMFALAFMPLWIYTLGSIFTSQLAINIPFISLIGNIFTTVGPCLFGVLLGKYFPKTKKVVLKIAKPVILFVVLSTLVFTIYAKYYVFFLVNLKQWLIAPFLPWSGYLIGGFVAWCARLEPKQIRTIAIEVGIQNVGIAFLIVFNNFPSPESDYAILPLISVSLLTIIPLMIILIILTIVRKIRGYYNEGKELDKNKEAELKNQGKDDEIDEQTKFELKYN